MFPRRPAGSNAPRSSTKLAARSCDISVPLLPAIRISELQPGDLVFCSRPGRLQFALNRCGDPWRHVGVVVDLHGQRSVVEVGMTGRGERPIAALCSSYRLVGIGRTRLDPARLDAAVAESAAHAVRFAWLAAALTGAVHISVHSLTGRPVAGHRELLDRSEALLDRGGSIRRVTCVTFVVSLLRAAGAPLAAELLWEDRPRLLVTPGVLWRSAIVQDRFVLTA